MKGRENLDASKSERNLNQETLRLRALYERHARFYALIERLISPELSQRAFGLARGRVLEVGVGTGRNFEFYPSRASVTAIDLSPAMLLGARERAHSMGVPVTLLQMDVQEMSFASGEFDTVIATFVFCSVPDPIKGLSEIARVCRADGTIVLVEHVRSDRPVLGRLMDLINPLSVRLLGEHINRQTIRHVQAAGLHVTGVEEFGYGTLNLITASPGKRRREIEHTIVK